MKVLPVERLLTRSRRVLVQGGVSFSTQSSAFTAVSSRVTPGNGAGSSFYDTVNSGAMPRGQAKLSAANLALIKAWIDSGAMSN
jgi:hypothetical protein